MIMWFFQLIFFLIGYIIDLLLVIVKVMGKKKFIDKKKAATFQLLARDSSSPNLDGTLGNDRVFVRVDNNPFSVDNLLDGNNSDGYNNSDSVFADAPEDKDDGHVFGNSMPFHEECNGSTEKPPLPESIRKEILELGFPDDGYNYLTHLREIKNTGAGSAFYHNPKFRLDELPRDVKAYDASRVRISEVKNVSDEKSIYGVASKTVGVKVQKAIDLEVAALLNDSDLSRFGSDAEDLEEDFIVLANLPEEGLDREIDEKLNLEEHGDEKKLDINGDSVSCGNLVVKEAKNDYFVAKPRVHRALDEQFDLLECQEYGTDDDDDDYGDYFPEEEESLAHKLNHVLNDRVKDDLELDDEYKAPADLLHVNEGPKSKERLDSAAEIIRRCAEYAERYENESEGQEEVFVEESSDESEQWDCETIISTYSNLDNHPGKIGAPETRRKKLIETLSDSLRTTNHVISLRGKEQLPVNFLPHRRKAAAENVKAVSITKTNQPKRKPRGQESKEEKKERKTSLKEERREARRAKKEMKGLYRGEAQHAQMVAAISGPSSIRLM